MPAVENVTLNSRGAGETGYTAVPDVQARRKSANPDVVLMIPDSDISQGWVMWEIYLTAALTVSPKVKDSITDAAGVSYQILHMPGGYRVAGSAFQCTCLQNR